MFVEYNANPNGDNIGDCVIRAITKVLNLDYWDVFDELCDLMDETPGANYINQYSVFKKFFDNHGWEIREVTSKRTVKQFAEQFNCLDYILLVRGHMTAICNGDIYDTWNPSRYRVQFVIIPCK